MTRTLCGSSSASWPRSTVRSWSPTGTGVRRSSGGWPKWCPQRCRGRGSESSPARRTTRRLLTPVTTPGRSRSVRAVAGPRSEADAPREIVIDAGGQGSGSVNNRKRQALELFAGLPRRYDAAGAVLSFGQDPRWRQAMVAQVGARAAGAGARCRDRNRHGRGGARAPLRMSGRRARPEPRDARSGGGEAAREPGARIAH